MKKILLLIALLVSALTFAQNNGITYQAVIYSTNGEAIPGIQNPNSPLVNKAICLQFSVIDSNTQTEYQEKVAITTDSFGMVNLVIGNGTQSGGYASSFNAIAWSNSKKYLKVSVDQSGNCNSFEEISNQLLTYVPFALAADNAASVSGIVGIANGGTNATTVVGAKTNLQLQNVDNTSDINKPLSTATQTALNSKVDKVVGKDLSTNDFTTVEKTKLAEISGVNTGDQDLSSYATLTNLDTKVDKVTGKGLSTEDFTTAEKAKLASLGSAPDLSGYATTSSLSNAVTNKFVDLTTNQTVVGKKNFSSDIVVNGLTIGKGKGQNDQNTAIGAGALNSSNSNGTRNTAVGALALANYAGTTFDNNTGVGYFNMIGLTTGYGNTSLGAETMFNVGATSNNTAIGNQSLINAAGDNNVGVGARSGDGLTIGTNNTFIGTQARTLSSSATISNATALGYGAVVTENNTIQLGNLGVTNVKTSGAITASGFKTPTGTSSQYLMADGSIDTNTYVASNTDNVAIGYVAGTGGQGLHSIAIGSNVAQGAQAEGGVGVGYAAAQYNQGENAVAIGKFAGQYNQAANSVAIGADTQVSGLNSVALGFGAIAATDNTIQLGNVSVTDVKTNGAITASSFKTPTGTSSQYLMADGSVSTSTLSNYLPLAGGNIAGTLSIGTSSPQSSAVLDVSSTTQGFLPPRMTQSQRNTINNPVAGLVIWCKNCGENGELQVFNGTNWTNFIGGSASEPLAIGSSFKGGKIAYILQSGDPGYIDGEFHGIIVSNSDLSNGIRWGQNNDGLSTTYDCTNRHGSSGYALPCAIGTGRTNTSLIISSNTEVNPTDYAAKICDNYSTVYNGVTYDDWFLPSYNEMLKVYQNKNAIGGLFYDAINPSSKSNWYWTSTGDVFQDRAADVNSNDGNKARSFRGNLLSVRAVRYF